VGHGDCADEIRRLQLSQQCKRRAEETHLLVRQISDDVWRSSANTGQQLTFADMEGSMYKRHRKAQPVL